MRLYIFKSESMDISAFAEDREGSRLPEKFKPWTADGIVEAGKAPPRNLSRTEIESAVKAVGFQLWRLKRP
jgi:hypothetical protein